MTVKTRAEIKGENAADLPDNTAKLISPADLRGQLDDTIDSAFLAEDLDKPGGPASWPVSGGGGGGGSSLAGVTFAELPASPSAGTLAHVTDGLSTTPGTTQGGGGFSATLVWFNGLHWTVVGT